MTDISKLSRLLAGVQQQVDLSVGGNVLVVDQLKVGGASGTVLTKTILDSLIADSDGRVKVSAADTTVAYLGATIIAGSALTSTILSPGADETLSLDVAVDGSSIEVSGDALRVKAAGITSAMLAGSIDATKIADGSVTSVEFQYIGGLTSDAQTQITARALDSAVIKKDGSVAYTAAQSMGGFKLTNLAAGTAASDAVNKSQMDAALEGLKPKAAARAATTASITIATDLNVGDVIDGVTLTSGDRVLVKDQASPAENGIYIAGVTPARSTDFDSVSPIDEINGAMIAVEEGTTHAGKIFVQSGAAVAVVGTDPIAFVFFSSVAILVGGDMITVSGTNIAVDLATVSGLESTNPSNVAGQLRVKLEAATPSLKITASNELAAKLDAAGAIASGASGLATQVDASTIEISTNALRVKDAGITAAKLATNSVTTVKILNANVTAGKMVAGSANEFKTPASAHDTTMRGGSGDKFSVLSSPSNVKTLVAGETITASVSTVVRWMRNTDSSPVGGRIMKADNVASVNDNFYGIGVALSTSGAAVAGMVNVTTGGTHVLAASNTTPFTNYTNYYLPNIAPAGTGLNADAVSGGMVGTSMIVGGYFTTLHGNTRNCLVRFNNNGTENTAFYTALTSTGDGTGFNGAVRECRVQGSVYVGGDFTALNGNTRNRIAKVSTAGTEDTAFYTALTSTGDGTGFNGAVYVITRQADGKVVVAGDFTALNGLTRNRIVRLTSTGLEDTAFYTALTSTGDGTGPDGYFPVIRGIALQTDQKLVIAGEITTMNGFTRHHVIRLNTDGTEDTAFNTAMGTGFGSSTTIATIQTDQKILVGGYFTTFNGNTRRFVIRLNTDGTEDTAFYTALISTGTFYGLNGIVNDIQVQTDGSILVGGSFQQLNGLTNRAQLVRLTSTGLEDTAFNVALTSGNPYNSTGLEAASQVIKIMIQSDAKINIVGSMSSLNGNTRRQWIRLTSAGAEDTGESFWTESFSASDIGKPVYLTTAGGFSTTPPVATNTAVYRIGIVEDRNKIWVGDKQLLGIN